MGVASGSVRIDTIASWSHHLVRQYPDLAGITVAADPDWAESVLYYDGACRVAASPAFPNGARRHVRVRDGYQDCTARQHTLVQALADAVPLAVFGDPLRAIFGWEAFDPLPPWRDEVQRLWPDLPHPWHRGDGRGTTRSSGRGC